MYNFFLQEEEARKKEMEEQERLAAAEAAADGVEEEIDETSSGMTFTRTFWTSRHFREILKYFVVVTQFCDANAIFLGLC